MDGRLGLATSKLVENGPEVPSVPREVPRTGGEIGRSLNTEILDFGGAALPLGLSDARIHRERKAPPSGSTEHCGA